MRANMPGVGPTERETNSTRLREHAESTLNAIAGAISTGRLPPDDAFAWARIAACETEILGEIGLCRVEHFSHAFQELARQERLRQK
jgi:hypothetical protein